MFAFEPLEDRRLLAVVPIFSKLFDVDTIGPGNVSTLTFQIDNTVNPTEGVNDLAFTDDLPAGVTIAGVPNITQSFAATVSAPAGGSTISLSDGRLGAAQTGTFTVDVTSSALGAHTNTTGDLTSDAGNSGTATDDLTVAIDHPGFTMEFADATIPQSGRTTLTYTIDNSASEVPASFIAFTDTLPAGLEIAGPSNASTTVTGGEITAVPGGDVISFEFGTLLGGATGTVAVDVIATGVGVLENVTGDLTTFVENATRPSGKASDSIEATALGAIGAATSFTDDPAAPSGTVNAEITFTNFSRNDAATNIAFSLDLGAGLPGLAAIGLPQDDVLGLGSQLSQIGGVLSLTGGSLGPGGSATINVGLQVPGNAAPGAYDFNTSSLQADIGGDTTTSAPTTDTLFVASFPLLNVTFNPNPVLAGGTATLDFSVQNTDPNNAATTIALTVDFPEILPTAVTLPQNGDLGPSSVFAFTPLTDDPSAGTTPARLTLSGGGLDPGASDTFSITLDVAADAPNGAYPTSTSEITTTVDGQAVTGEPATDDLLVVAGPSVAMSFADPVQPGDTVALEFRLNQNQNSPTDATDINFMVDLGAVIPGLAATDTPKNDVVGAGSQISGTSVLTFTGGILAPGETAVFDVTVQVPPETPGGSYTVTSGDVNSTVGGLEIAGDRLSDDLDVEVFTFEHSFDDPVIPGQTTKLNYTLSNVSTSGDVTNADFTHDLSDVMPGLVSTSGTLTDIAGPGSQITGTSLLTFTGGNLQTGESASFSVDVTVPIGAATNTYNSLTSSLTYLFDGDPVTGDPSTDLLEVVEAVSFTKQFLPDQVAAGETTILEYTIANNLPDTTLSAITFTDDLDAVIPGLAATDTPKNDVVGSGSQIAGTSFLTLTGGNLAGGDSATFQVTVQIPVNAAAETFTNVTSDITGDAEGTSFTVDPASDTLTVSNLPDFGDAPDSYKTRLTSDGARHAPGGPRLGALRDYETDASSPSDGTGDDVTNLPDEDGVTFGTLEEGALGSVTVTLGPTDPSGQLDAWFDFNNDGDFDDAGEKVLDDETLLQANAPQTLTFAIPTGVIPFGTASSLDTFARFRLSTAGGLDFFGPAADGEVEDYPVTLTQIPDVSVSVSPDRVLEDGPDNLVFTFERTGSADQPLTVYFAAGGTAQFGPDYTQTGAATFGETGGTVLFPANVTSVDVIVDPRWNPTYEKTEGVVLRVKPGEHYGAPAPTWARGFIINDDFDFGDAPDSYKTTVASNGPRHKPIGPRLGYTADAEPDGLASGDALGDDLHRATDDEDGVTFTSILRQGQTATLRVRATLAGQLDAFLDYNADGSFAGPGEKIFHNVSLAAGDNELSFAIPANARSSSTYARFRISRVGGRSFVGFAPDGEVEDYRVTIGVSLSATQLGNGIYQFDSANATPGGLVTFVYGTRPGNLYLRQYGVTIGVRDPVFFGQGIADSGGTATSMLVVPPSLRGQTLYFDAFEQGPNVQANPDLLSFVPLNSADGVGGGAAQLDPAQLGPIVGAAIERWPAAGLSDEQMRLLGTVVFEIADLPGNQLAHASQTTVVVDTTAAGHGWYVDVTPANDEEFNRFVGGTELSSVGGEHGRQMDLLTVVMHEMGHVLHRPDEPAAATANSLMADTLAAGRRRLPDLSALQWSAGGHMALVPTTNRVDVAIHGTQGDDALRFTADSDYHAIGLNGDQYFVATAAVRNVIFRGLAGTDSASVTDKLGDTVARLYPRRGFVQGLDYRLVLASVESIRVLADHSGNNLALLTDSAAAERLLARPQRARLWGGGFNNLVLGFDRIDVVSQTTHDLDRAFFRDAENNPVERTTFDELADYALSMENDWLS